MNKYLGAVILLFSLGLVQAQDEVPTAQEEVKKTAIKLASPTVQPGQRTYVTILVSNAEDVAVAEMEHWLQFPKSKLTYLSTRAGIAADLAQAKVTVETQDDPDGDTVTLHLSVKGGSALPDGPVAEITFDVGEITPEDIVLPHRLEVSNSDGERINDVEFQDALLKVSHVLPDAPPAIFSCFFYMH